MLETSNPSINIEDLLKRVRDTVARTHRATTEAGTVTHLPELVVGAVLHFGANGDAGPYLATGWSTPEPKHHWTEGREAVLRFEVPDATDVVLAFDVTPLIGGSVSAQHVQAEWNGELVGEWSIRQPGTYATIVWSRHLRASRSVTLRFLLHSACSPVSAGINQDPRELALYFSSLRLSPVSDLGA